MRILFPLPSREFDPTEASAPWKALLEAGHELVFATPDGRPGAADPRILSGRGFGPFRPWLQARPHGRKIYQEMASSKPFLKPLSYDEINPEHFDGVVLTGGHAPGMKGYLEAGQLQQLVLAHMKANKPVGAICHGVLIPARTIDPDTGKSVLYGRKTTAVTRAQELSAWMMTGLWLGSYYRTYKKTVQQEVTEALKQEKDFMTGAFTIRREKPNASRIGFVVRDGNYVSARYYVDAYRFGEVYVKLLAESSSAQ